MFKADYIFETSWEICNKVGGIHTVLSTKSVVLQKELGDRLIMIGPDVWKETSTNPEFIEDENLLKTWKIQAEKEGLKLRTGRWKIGSNPLVILVDFTPFFASKNEIFANFWENYKLNSLHGQWDYIEPAMFGYAAGKVIESYYNFYLTSKDKIVAQFHEWMTGAGVLYLKDQVPQIGTVFTTHATVIGRSIAGNGLPLYEKLDQYNGEMMASHFNVSAKHSLEKIAGFEADAFTTVSEITSTECEQLLEVKPDVVTSNGFDDAFVPSGKQYESKRIEARDRILSVSAKIFGHPLKEDTVLVLNSGRYEFHNKGIDTFIDALGKLNRNAKMDRDVLAIVSVPAHHSGPRMDLLDKVNVGHQNPVINPKHLSHFLYEEQHDPVLQSFRSHGLNNEKEDKVKVLFVPAYLNGHDGIINLDYFDFLIGFDYTVFPSYYEPWGYTPMESTAFRIPSLTTNYAGFGRWILSRYTDGLGVKVVDRTSLSNEETGTSIAEALLNFIQYTNYNDNCERAHEISRMALWKNLVKNYYQAYNIALAKSDERSELYIHKLAPGVLADIEVDEQAYPVWKKFLVNPGLSKKLQPLDDIAKNLWWSWNEDAIDLFESIDPELWQRVRRNPVKMIEFLSIEKIEDLEKSTDFLHRLKNVHQQLKEYLNTQSEEPGPSIAYFSMEYGLNESLKIYSGGLGILAGDYLKEVSDLGKNLVAFGLMYRYGYFMQQLSVLGGQIAHYKPQKFSHLPLIPVRDEKGNWIKVTLALPGRNLVAKTWLVNVGRIKLYLLDADIEENQEQDRQVTHQLYGGDWENRFKQELLLGVGGIRLIKELGLKPDVYHSNEGHSAFIGLERLRVLVEEENIPLDVAKEIVRGSTLFTTHTPVPAGHDTFEEDLLRTYVPHYPDRLKISWSEFMGLGRMNKYDHSERFSMSVLAAKLSQEINGVSKIHGGITQHMLASLYPGYFPKENHISYVTNGVHFPTWTAKEWKKLFDNHMHSSFQEVNQDAELWKRIHDVSDDAIWEARKKLKNELFGFIRRKLEKDMTRRQENPKLILSTLESLQSDALTIGFARRFATYKRAGLLFNNLERLEKLVNHAERPIRFVYAGKAHPNDQAGQDLIKRIIEISKMPAFIGKIIFLENYDMNIGKKLVQGVDVWLNTPTRPMEASGTSGEKAIMNGVLNFSVLDGWWAEGYKQEAGWAIKEEKTYQAQHYQDDLDAETLYNILENEIAALYFEVNENGIPKKWVQYIKNNIAEIAPHFTMRRMVNDYYKRFYNKLGVKSKKVHANDYQFAFEMEAWKKSMTENWQHIKVHRLKVPDPGATALKVGHVFKAEVSLDLNGVSPEYVNVEIVLGHKSNDIVKEPIQTDMLSYKGVKKGKHIYDCEIPTSIAGVFDYSFRIYAIHPELPHRQDFILMKWA